MDHEEKTQAQKLKEELCLETKHSSLVFSEGQVEDAKAFCEGYKHFLTRAKTERESVSETVQMAQQNGFVPFVPDTLYAPGDKVYAVNRDKSMILAVFGTEPIGNGCHVVAAHIDTPHIDLKPKPLYEQNELAFFKTHYYGGIKKYQWGTVPMSLHGIVMRADGEKIQVQIGEAADDPVFCINDLLIHLATNQMKRPARDLLSAEELNVLVGSYPFKDNKESQLVKLNILRLLHEKYDITERDLISAELQVVPAYPARDIGFDRSMVGGYGQDDRVCAYTAVQAILDCPNPGKTALVFLSDKEETGSDGNTGMKSAFFVNFIHEIAHMGGAVPERVTSSSFCISADVHTAYDPTFSDAYELTNTIFFNHGVAVAKYTGARGKSGTSDASAETLNQITRLLDKKGIPWQIGEYGKTDLGGGGTVAMFLANTNMDVLDMGPSVLSMHAPFEITSKLDIYAAYQAYLGFLTDMSHEGAML